MDSKRAKPRFEGGVCIYRSRKEVSMIFWMLIVSLLYRLRRSKFRLDIHIEL